MPYSIVTNNNIISRVKKCRYFKQNLGLVSTIDKSGERVANEKDKFSFFYNTQYRTTIYMQGNIGDIIFYLDYYIKKDQLAVYVNSEEFIFDFDKKMVDEKGIEFYIGHILKTIETQHEERLVEAENKKIETKRAPDSEMLKNSPGAATYDDIKAYLEKKNRERYNTGSNSESST